MNITGFRGIIGLATFVLIGGCQAMANVTDALSSRTEQTNEHGRSSQIYLNHEDPSLDTLGSLEWLGGLKLTSSQDQFGGISGLLVSADGKRFLSVTDKGYWLRGTLDHRKGALTGAGNFEIAPMLGLDGMPIEGKTLGDAESLIGDLDGSVLVSFERAHRIWAYDLSGAGFEALPTTIFTPDEFSSIVSNGGLEGITSLKDAAGTLLALTEYTQDKNGNILGWLVGRDGRSEEIALNRILPFALTDLATLPNGDILTLERSFSPAAGAGFQMRRIDGATIKPGAVLDGPVLASARRPYSVDNMEGLDVRRGKNGEILIYIISDDNFNPLQRTLLMQFRLINAGE